MKKLVCLTTTAAMMLASAGFAIAADKEKKKIDPEARFQKMDKNGDGKVSLDEFVGKRTGEKKEKAEKAFAKRDKDGDGNLTKDEFMPAKKAKKNKKKKNKDN
ncbi:EF hand [Planctomycetes bacterium Pan216]|uniref:EF hand n=1 Tax=Kolteria novifilia TaxID=2527975 RepID=A0A518BBA9_9BACT|nr:EF hand [Planctomycetes bacterium Pan216]